MTIASKLGVRPPKKFAHKIGIPSSKFRWLRHTFHRSSNLFKCWVRNAVIGPWIEIHSMDLVAKDGMQSTVNIAVRYIRVSIPSMQISKRYCLIRAHTLTVLSVTKAKASSYRLSFNPRLTVHPILSSNPIFPAQNMKQNGIKNQG